MNSEKFIIINLFIVIIIIIIIIKMRAHIISLFFYLFFFLIIIICNILEFVLKLVKYKIKRIFCFIKTIIIII
jgi:hypothetical protein